MRTWLMAGAAAIILGACSAGPDIGVATLGDKGATPLAEKSVDPEEAQLAFAECMREHGIDMPDPATGGRGGRAVEIFVEEDVDEDVFREADEECRPHLEGVFDEPSEAQQQEFMDSAVEFARCMRANGVENHPDPQFENGGMTIEISGSDIMDDPDFAAAEKKCRKELPGGGEGMVLAP